LIGGQAIEPDRKYKVAMTEPLAVGAYGYFSVWGKNEPKPVKDITIGVAVKDFLSTRPR
jgi:hypothetical protein